MAVRFSVERMSSYKTDDKSLYHILSAPEQKRCVRFLNRPSCVSVQDTHGRVYSHRLSY